MMSKILDKLRSRVVARDPAPLHSLTFSWAEERGRRERLPFTQERLLESVNESPCLNTTERIASLGWTNNRFQRARKELEEHGHLETQELAKGAGRPDTHLVLTDKGFSCLRRLRVAEKRLHGSLEHHCAILRMESHFRSLGYATEAIKKITPKLIVDLFCEKGDERGVVEVVASNNLKRDAGKCAELAKRTSWIHLVATSRELFDYYRARLGKELADSASEKVRVSFADELVSAER